MSIRFLVDAQLPPGLCLKLAERGFPAKHVTQIGLSVASDAKIWGHARRTGAVVITKDQDFVTLARDSSSGPAVVWVRIGNVANEPLWRVIEPLLDEIVQALVAGEKIVEVR